MSFYIESKLQEMSNCSHENQVTMRNIRKPHCRTCCCCIDDIEIVHEMFKLREKSRCPHESQEVIGAIQSPHCRTCCCVVEDMDIVHEMSDSCTVRMPPQTVHPILQECICECHREEDLCSHCLHPKVIVNLQSVDKCPRCLTNSDNTYKTLKRWFIVFDLNEDGFLDFTEFKYLLEFLGISLDNSKTRRLLNRSDSNMDGRLSFSDFLWMWHEAAMHESEFLAETEAHDLIHIVNKYDLFPQEPRKHVLNCKTEIKPRTNEPNCDCGIEEVDLFIDSDELGADIDIKRTSLSQTSAENSNTQTFSEIPNPPKVEDHAENAGEE